jgi:hypothetical protein
MYMWKWTASAKSIVYFPTNWRHWKWKQIAPVFQREGISPHFSHKFQHCLNPRFSNQWNGKKGLITWLPRRFQILKHWNFHAEICEKHCFRRESPWFMSPVREILCCCSDSYSRYALSYLGQNWIPLGCLQGYKWYSYQDMDVRKLWEVLHFLSYFMTYCILNLESIFNDSVCIHIKIEGTIHNEENCDVCLCFENEEYAPYSSRMCKHPGSCRSLQSLQWALHPPDNSGMPGRGVQNAALLGTASLQRSAELLTAATPVAQTHTDKSQLPGFHR